MKPTEPSEIAARTDPPPPQAGGVAALLDRATRALSFLWLGLIGIIVAAVVLRFVFGVGRIELEELQWHLYAIGFLTGIVGCTLHDRHVRVDVLRDRMPRRVRDWVDLYGLLLFQLPLVLLVLWSALPFVAESFRAGESSVSAGGLPYRWLLKAFLPLAFIGVGAASGLHLRRVARRLFGEDGSDPAVGPDAGVAAPTRPTDEDAR